MVVLAHFLGGGQLPTFLFADTTTQGLQWPDRKLCEACDNLQVSPLVREKETTVKSENM